MDKQISKNFNPNPQKYFSVRAFCERHNLTNGTVRSWIFFGKQNGFSKCLRKVGKKIYISEPDYFHWMEENQYAS